MVSPERPDCQEVTAKNENRDTGFPDWSHPEYQRFVLEFYQTFAQQYDRDRRLAFLEIGFGLWAAYHVYSGPEELGKTFPSKAFQARFFQHLAKVFKETPWMISQDAQAEKRTPFASQPTLLKLTFGIFDDFKILAFEASPNESRVTVTNTGVAPIYYDAFVAVNRVRAGTSLKHLQPDETRQFTVATGGMEPKLAIECDRLVLGQQITFDADLK